MGMGNRGGVGYPSDVSDDEWAFVAPYLTLCREDAKQREYPLRAVFNAVRWLVRSGAHWRMMPNDLPPWPVVYQQTQRWIRAGCFEMMVGGSALSAARVCRSQTPADARWCWTAAPCNPRRNRERGADTTERSGAKDRRCTRRWIRWAICWRLHVTRGR